MEAFGKFRLVERIGGGQLSQVYRVRPLSVPRDGDGPGEAALVALKRVNPEMIGEPAFVQLVVREAGMLTRLEHRNLCQCHELGVIDGCAFLTLSLVEGCTLRAFLRWLARLSLRLPLGAIVAFGYQLAGVLGYLHHRLAHPVLHLDLSPQNVMIDRFGEIKLIDFGISRYLDGHDPPPIGGKIAGTVGYMSPEQASGAPLDPRADQYGLGILLWEMLAGQRLFRGNRPETWQRMIAGDVPPAGQVMRAVPDPLSGLVYRLLGPSPSDRFERMDQILAALEACTPVPLLGQRVLADMVQRLMRTPSFDPHDDVRRPRERYLAETDIPSGAGPAEEYAELQIEVDQGMDSPASLVRAVLPEAPQPPSSPFLEPE